MTTFGSSVTLTFDLLTSKSVSFSFVNECTDAVYLVKFPGGL